MVIIRARREEEAAFLFLSSALSLSLSLSLSFSLAAEMQQSAFRQEPLMRLLSHNVLCEPICCIFRRGYLNLRLYMFFCTSESLILIFCVRRPLSLSPLARSSFLCCLRNK